MNRIVILMGSKADLEHCNKMATLIEKMGVQYEMHIASAQKTPKKVLEILGRYEYENVVYITVAGRSNALSGFADANTSNPVIACPPPSDKFGGMDILSTIRMPGGVAPMLVLEPEAAVVAAVKILSFADTLLKKKIVEFQESLKNEIEKCEAELQDSLRKKRADKK